jgi:hypothetical protein
VNDCNEARRVLDLEITEKQFQQGIVDLAQRTGWMVFHPYDMRRSREGYPDLTMAHEGRGLLVFAELKRESDRAQLSDHQYHWLRVLGEVARKTNQEAYYTRMVVALWRPSDWQEIEKLLTEGK